MMSYEHRFHGDGHCVNYIDQYHAWGYEYTSPSQFFYGAEGQITQTYDVRVIRRR